MPNKIEDENKPDVLFKADGDLNLDRSLNNEALIESAINSIKTIATESGNKISYSDFEKYIHIFINYPADVKKVEDFMTANNIDISYEEPSVSYRDTSRLSAVAAYFEMARQFPVMTEADEKFYGKILKTYPSDSPEYQSAKEEFINRNLRFAYKTAFGFSQTLENMNSNALDVEDLLGEAQLGLIKAVDKYNVDLGYRFLTFARWWIRQAVIKKLQEGKAVRIPASMLKKIKDYLQAQEEYTDEHGRQATDDQLCKILGWKPDTLATVKEVYVLNLAPVSLDRPLGDTDDMILTEVIADPNSLDAIDEIDSKYSKDETLKKLLDDLIALYPVSLRGLALKFRYGIVDPEIFSENSLYNVNDLKNLRDSMRNELLAEIKSTGGHTELTSEEQHRVESISKANTWNWYMNYVNDTLKTTAAKIAVGNLCIELIKKYFPEDPAYKEYIEAEASSDKKEKFLGICENFQDYYERLDDFQQLEVRNALESLCPAGSKRPYIRIPEVYFMNLYKKEKDPKVKLAIINSLDDWTFSEAFVKPNKSLAQLYIPGAKNGVENVSSYFSTSRTQISNFENVFTKYVIDEYPGVIDRLRELGFYVPNAEQFRPTSKVKVVADESSLSTAERMKKLGLYEYWDHEGEEEPTKESAEEEKTEVSETPEGPVVSAPEKAEVEAPEDDLPDTLPAGFKTWESYTWFKEHGFTEQDLLTMPDEDFETIMKQFESIDEFQESGEAMPERKAEVEGVVLKKIRNIRKMPVDVRYKYLRDDKDIELEVLLGYIDNCADVNDIKAIMSRDELPQHVYFSIANWHATVPVSQSKLVPFGKADPDKKISARSLPERVPTFMFDPTYADIKLDLIKRPDCPVEILFWFANIPIEQAKYEFLKSRYSSCKLARLRFEANCLCEWNRSKRYEEVQSFIDCIDRRSARLTDFKQLPYVKSLEKFKNLTTDLGNKIATDKSLADAIELRLTERQKLYQIGDVFESKVRVVDAKGIEHKKFVVVTDINHAITTVNTKDGLKREFYAASAKDITCDIYYDLDLSTEDISVAGVRCVGKDRKFSEWDFLQGSKQDLVKVGKLVPEERENVLLKSTKPAPTVKIKDFDIGSVVRSLGPISTSQYGSIDTAYFEITALQASKQGKTGQVLCNVFIKDPKKPDSLICIRSGCPKSLSDIQDSRAFEPVPGGLESITKAPKKTKDNKVLSDQMELDWGLLGIDSLFEFAETDKTKNDPETDKDETGKDLAS